MAEAGKRTIPFLIESVTVGSNVTIAVMTANTGGHSSQIQINAVSVIATAVFTIRCPGKRKDYPYLQFSSIIHIIIYFTEIMTEVFSKRYNKLIRIKGIN